MPEFGEYIVLNHRTGIPLVQQLREQFVWMIASGKLRPGDTLPAVRVLARNLSINFNTVRNAYRLLEQDELVVTRQGSGTKVLPINPTRMSEIASKSRSHTIGVILPGIRDPFYHLVLQGIEEVAAASQTLMLVCDAHEDPALALQYYSQLTARQVDGIICASLPLASSIQMPGTHSPSLPYVSIDWPDDQENAVVLDLEKGGYDATRHLLEHHHERIGLIMANEGLANTRPILAGYMRALAERNLPFIPDLVVNVTGFLMTDGLLGAVRLLERFPRPTAILTISDMIALGVMKVIREKKMRIPEDIAIIGMGDIDLVDMVEPRLTSISTPASELGREGMKLLEQLMHEKSLPSKQITLPTHIVIRESCGCRIS